MIKKSKLFITFGFAICLLIFNINNAGATCCKSGDDPSMCDVCITDPLTGKNADASANDQPDPNLIIGKTINAVLGIVGSLALVMFIYGGILWMTSAGNDQRVQKGKDTLLWAVIGLIVIFSSYAMVNFVLNDVIGDGNSNASESGNTSGRR